MKVPFGRKHSQIASAFLPSAMGFGFASFLTVLYFTDWKVVLQYVPIYNTKFKKDD